MNFIPYGRQFIDDDDVNEAAGVFKSDFITQGPKILEFENMLAEHFGAMYAVVFNSGTSALHGAYFSAGLEQDDEFITTPNTFVATSNAGLYLGANPVFVDVEKDTGNIDPEKIADRITKKTKLIVPVHYAGHPVDLAAVKSIAQKHDIRVIEDACHALGALYMNTRTGSCKYSDMTVFSFHPVKHITTGEGGAVLTNNKDYHEKLLMFRTHGITKNNFNSKSDGDWYYEMQFLGYNYRMTDIQAALGISQLKKLDKFVEKRRKIAKTYSEAFNGNIFFEIPAERDYACSSYHLYTIKLNKEDLNSKNEIFIKLREKGIGLQVHYIPVYMHPYYQSLGYKKGLCPDAEDFYKRVISIPIYPSMTDEMVNYVIKNIKDFYE